MRRLAANYVFPISSPPIKNGIVEVTDDGQIIKIIDPGAKFQEMRKVEFYNGVLVPGFINCHCHLELSALKGYVKPDSGLPRFVNTIRKKRHVLDEKTNNDAIVSADREMKHNGIIVSADISNTADSFDVKSKSEIQYYTFLEIFGIKRQDIRNQHRYARNLYEEMTKRYRLEGNLTPHAAYSVSTDLLNLIFRKPENKTPVYSFHYRECSPETEKKLKRKIKLRSFLTSLDFNVLFSNESKHREHVLSLFPENQNCLLVHNTYAGEEDIDKAVKYLNHPYWVFCPNSNLSIENKLPDIELFAKRNQVITIGTDSLASNNHLSILGELITLQKALPEILMDELFKWATLNGAKALHVDDYAGSFEKGKKPGVNLVTNLDFSNWKLQESSKVKTIL